jgi:DNA-binding SARP family transcriptional activator/TolB-like protein
MLSQRRFRLVTLGKLELSSSAGETFHVQEVRPRHLAVLAVLALSRQPIRRDALVEMFWGGETDDRARHTLSNALSSLRAILGPDAISARNDAVSIDDSTRLEVDAIQFTSACEVHDDERAVALYGGEFLGGVHVQDAAAFDRWRDRERGRLSRDFQQACERLVPALLRAGRFDDAARFSERWLDAAPESTLAFTCLLRARADPGNATAITGALAEYERVRDSLWREYEVRPHAAVLELVAELREQRASIEQAQVAPTIRSASVAPASARATPRKLDTSLVNPPSSKAVDSSSRIRAGQRAWQLGALTVALIIAIGIWTARKGTIVAAEARRPVVAVTAIDDVVGDTSVAWIRAGLPRLIASDLEAMGGIEVVAPSRVREVTVRLAGSSAARITEDQAIDIARRVGATWVVLGGVSNAKEGYVLDITVREVAKPEVAQSFTLLSADLMELGRLAASRLATALNVESSSSGGSAQYAEVATANPAAYQYFVRGMVALEGGRYAESARDLDSAIARDSGFIDAVRVRRGLGPDERTDRVLAGLAIRYANRLSEFQRVSDEIHNLDTLGESARAEALSAQLVARFPHDPRAYSLQADQLTGPGRWAAAEQVLLRELALDSLAMSAGNGPCTPCEVLWRLSQVRLLQGNPVGADQAARRWVALQPDLPAAWRNLSATLAATGHAAEAEDAGQHVMALSKEPSAAVDFGRSMIAARRYGIVDSLVSAWRDTRDAVLAEGALDLRALVERERGEFSASAATLARLDPNDGSILMLADDLSRLGRAREARQILERSGHRFVATAGGQLTPPQARGFAWAHALEADEEIRSGDTSRARALIDSLLRAGQQSYYGRDRLLYHHAQGMLYFAEHRFADAERELKAAEWSVSTWTRTNVELARAQLAQGHARDALATLRDAYLSPVDGMGRYVPRSELDWWMSRAFVAAGDPDSARVYAGYVRSAWRHADPAVAARLDSIPAGR